MAPYEALCGRQCRSPIGWFEPREAGLLGTDLVHDAMKKVKVIQERLHTAQSRQKSFADRKIWDIAYMVGEKKYHEDMSQVLDFSTVQLDENLAYEEEPLTILDRQVQNLRSKSFPSVKVH
ncbi:uncharacterized protein [Nicotiana tomentosiformis]|uniref:uncharacterized protein n=1 Tax=Nicotiana tomentosiformis TaxID=4098 RepID=UPI00388C90C2